MDESEQTPQEADLEQFIQEVDRLAADPAAQGLALEILIQDRGGRTVSPAALNRMSAEVLGLQRAVELEEERVAGVRGLSVMPGEAVARRNDEAPAKMTLGPAVLLGEDGVCRAQAYGYLTLVEDCLDVASPLWMDSQALRVYWLVLDPRARPVTEEMIQQALAGQGVKEGIKQDRIARTVAKARAGSHRRGAALVAAGTPPVPGRDGRIELLVRTERQAGEEQPDGSIDFREINYVPSVKEGELLARHHPAVPGRPGRDVRGNAIPAPEVRDQELKAGRNVRVEVQDGVEVFVAAISGGVRLIGDELSVSPLLEIDGNVNFSTGNLDFGGEIFIRGSVLQAFSVKAASHITIQGTVDSGAVVEGGGDVSVGGGIMGRKTKVTAGGRLRASFVQEATLRAGGDIELNRFAYQAELRAGGVLRIFKGGQKGGGSILGGQAWAGKGIDVYVAGSQAHVQTLLGAGVDPERVRQLDRLDQNLSATQALFRRLLTRFELGHFDVVQIRNMISASTGPRRKLLAVTARRLGEVAQVYQQLVRQRKKLEAEIGGQADTAEILVRDRAYPGVTVQVGEHRRKVTEELVSPRFHLEDGKLKER